EDEYMVTIDHTRTRNEAIAPRTGAMRLPRRTVARWEWWGCSLIGGVLGLGLILGALRLPAGAAAVVGARGCSRACGWLNNAGTVGNHACNSRFACNDNVGNVGSDACNGEGACLGNTGTVGNSACTGHVSCLNNTGKIGTGACDGEGACNGNTGTVG